MPIIQLPGGNNPLVGAGAAASAFDDRTRDLRRQKFQEQAQRRALEQRMAERQLLGQQRQDELGMRLAAGAQQEYMRREEQERRFQYAEKEQDRLDDRERMRWMREQGLNPDATGANFIDLAARYEALDPQTYDAEFLPWLRDATGIDFGEGEGQVMPTPAIIGSIDPEILREGYSYLGSKIVPAQEAADERAVQRAYEGGLQGVQATSPEWFDSQDGQEWALEYAAALNSAGTDPSRARRVQRDFMRAATTKIADRDRRNHYRAEIDRLVSERQQAAGADPLYDETLAEIRDLQAEIAGADDPYDLYLKAYSRINPEAGQIEAKAYSRGRNAAQAEFDMRAASAPRIDPAAHPKLYEAMRKTPPTEFEKHLDRNGINPAEITSEDHEAIATFKQRGERSDALQEEERLRRFPDRVPDEEELLQHAARNGVDVNDPDAVEAFRPRFEEFKRRQRLRQIEQMDSERGFRRG